MKMNAKNFFVAALATLAAAGAGDLAMAGSKFTGNGHVVITRGADGSGSATGHLGYIYNSTSTHEWLACQKDQGDAVFCHANDENNNVVACSVTSNYLAQAVASISPDAILTFRWNANGRCISITVSHSSEAEDKQG